MHSRKLIILTGPLVSAIFFMVMIQIPENIKLIREVTKKQYILQSTGVLHLGAHLGQEAAYYCELDKSVLWVEALPEIHSRLQEKISKFENQTALCALLGNLDGKESTFHISNNQQGVSSSLFEFGDYASGGKSLWPDLNLIMGQKITLTSVKLDSLLLANNVDVRNYSFWVVDLQGAEKMALEGAPMSLRSCEALYVEVSTVEVYKGGVLYTELKSYLKEMGFSPLWEPIAEHDNILFIRSESRDLPVEIFHSHHYLRHSRRRLEHLSSLGLDLFEKSVLEVGAGIGDHTHFYTDRGCHVTCTEVRPENLLYILKRYGDNADVEAVLLDMDDPEFPQRYFDIIHCYGLLYHLKKPEQAIQFLSNRCGGLLLIETCVSPGDDQTINHVAEPSHDFSQSFYGTGCRPTRVWVWNALKKYMPYVYATRTQPVHEEFPLDWSKPKTNTKLMRSVFVASKTPIKNRNLVNFLPQKQVR